MSRAFGAGSIISALIAAAGISGPVSAQQVRAAGGKSAVTATLRDNAGTRAMRKTKRGGGGGYSDQSVAGAGVPGSFWKQKRGGHGKQNSRGSWRTGARQRRAA